MLEKDTIKFEIQNQTAIITLNRPAVHNAINAETIDQLESHLRHAEEDDKIRSIILTGSGDQSFCAGGDLAFFATQKSREQGRLISERMQAILNRIWSSDKVTIAAINGQALGGGCEILTACHFRIAAEHAAFCYRQAKNGIITGWGGGVKLLQLVGRQKGLRLLLTSDSINAEQAYRIGLVDLVVDSNQLLASSLEFAETINRNPASTISAFLQIARSLADNKLEDAKRFEHEAFLDLWTSDDFRQFLNKFARR